MSQETGIPLVATNDSHYLKKEDARAHEILMCIQTGKTMSDPNRLRFTNPEFYLKTRPEMMQVFGELEDAVNRPGKPLIGAVGHDDWDVFASRIAVWFARGQFEWGDDGRDDCPSA